MPQDRPVLGAAFNLEQLERHRDWLFERQRDLELQDFVDPHLLGGDWRGLADRAKALLDGHRGRLGLHGPFVGFTLETGDPEMRAVVQRRLDQILDVAGHLGATQIVLHSPFKTWDRCNLDALPGARDAMIGRVQATVSPALRRAEGQGVALVFENTEDAEPEARVALARSFGSAHARVSLDTGHAHYAHVHTGAPPVDFYARAAGDWLAHVHLQDTDGWADRHWVPGEGTICWPELFRTLATLESRPRLILELRDKDRCPEAAARLAAMGLAE
jgi:sugar phosphate isomerase/epimerase